MPASSTELNPKQKLFVLEYLKDMNATRAYKEVYKAATKVAETNSCTLLRNPKVKKAIDKKLKERFAKAEKDGQRVIDQLILLAEKCTQQQPIKKPTIIKHEDGTETVEYTDILVHDASGANAALNSLGKYYKLFIDRVEVEHKFSLSSLFDKTNEGRQQDQKE